VVVDKHRNYPSHMFAGPQELQLVLECAELYAASHEGYSKWRSLGNAMQACPYPALVEFTTRHGRTLLTLAECSLEAALAAAAGGAATSSSGSGVWTSAAAAKDHPWEATEQLFRCLTRCLMGGSRARAGADGSNTYEAKGGG
jgi:hypothetical protein